MSYTVHNQSCPPHTHHGEGGKRMMRLKPTYDVTQLAPELKGDLKANMLERLTELTIAKMEEVRHGENRHFH